MRLLVVEDEVRIAEILRKSLGKAGFAVDSVASCGDAQAALEVGAYDAMILDLGLPDGDGLALLGQLRSRGNQTPILVLTARDAVEDRVNGLDTGADDYLVKPFAMTELIARTKALLRRPGGALGTTLKAGNVNFDTIGRDVTIGTVPLPLPRRESAILEHLMRRLGRVVPKVVLQEKLYGIDDELESNAIPVHVHHLRKKLIDAGAAAEIHTVRGLGYQCRAVCKMAGVPEEPSAENHYLLGAGWLYRLQSGHFAVEAHLSLIWEKMKEFYEKRVRREH